ncbi:MAG TPA: triose-phosphate isomerase family protein [Patescibacteria group bacterium]|nr:triose-phosphate isomerase family protein [Patescibacteria group bacterium]
MKNLFIAGNWKSNKTNAESQVWVKDIASKLSDISADLSKIPVVVCVPFTSLSVINYALKAGNVPLALGTQNVSKFDEGAYTGEVTAKMVKEVADWVIIGHSERRKYFNETDEDLAIKAQKAKGTGLRVIFCVPDDKTPVPTGVDVVGYEPVWAIGTGKTDSPENAAAVVTSIKAKTKVATVIYGGSVTGDNVDTFVSQSAIDGVLPGGASLDPEKFSHLIHAALAATK